MKTPGFFLNLALLFALQIPSSGAQLAHFFHTEAWIGYLSAAALSIVYPVGCVVAWFGAVDRWGWNPLVAGAVFFALFMATVLNMIVKRNYGRMQGVAVLPDEAATDTDTTGADKHDG